MIAIPVSYVGHNLLIFILDGLNLSRMKLGDPISVPLGDYASYVSSSKIGDVEIWFAYEDDVEEINKRKGDIKELISYLRRGWMDVGNDGSLPKRVE